MCPEAALRARGRLEAPGELTSRGSGHRSSLDVEDNLAAGVPTLHRFEGLATWSTTWNYGPGWEDFLLDAYGVDPDAHRMRYYRLLWDLGP